MHIAARLAVEYVPEDVKAPSSRRRAARRPAQIQASMRTLGYHGADVVVRNISSEGFMATSREDFLPGSYVRLRIPVFGVLVAKVVWMKKGEVGCEFVNPLTPSRLLSLPGQRRLA